ncbi:hypothetical protein N1027_06485 [Herbiconiux sp. CPCC 205763]|uniref:Nuclear transport factor 2 family protein n=1 Tax=Herbiconiux aconitum TaxID=2970913 RepID=A0ABT2GR64_9MICO|nr:hypothetical protein [Herbiconiux aconitum]MCS5717780.1 hypothetical protein [Herbiconiux aconitum]
MSNARISAALDDLVFNPEQGVALQQVIDRYYAPDYTHRSDGKTLDREEFTEMVARTRDQVASGSVRVIDELRVGDSYAERHVLDLTLNNGSTQHREIAIFGTFAEDGRFRHLSETGFSLEAERPASAAGADSVDVDAGEIGPSR